MLSAYRFSVLCAELWKTFLIFVAVRATDRVVSPWNILDESVFAFILEEKSGQFQCIKEEQFHSSPCLAYRAFCTVTILGVGYCLFDAGLSRASLLINEKCSTLFCKVFPDWSSRNRHPSQLWIISIFLLSYHCWSFLQHVISPRKKSPFHLFQSTSLLLKW